MEREEFFKANGARIYGTLTLPNQVEKPPACLFIGGSFPQTRDGNIDNSKTDWFPTPLPERNLFRDEAKILEQIGMATFRYDKRGCGKSEGDFNTTTLFDLVDDARMALQWMRSLPEIDGERIGVLGQSEGAVIALMLAAKDPDIQFFVWQGGIYNNLEGIIKWQAEAFEKLESKTINNFKQSVPLIYWTYKQFDDIVVSVKKSQNFFRLGDENWSFNCYLPLWKEHFDNPPSIFVDKVKCPVLILHGDLDHNTPPSEAEQMQQALIQAGNTNVTANIFAGLDHSFRRLGDPDEDFVTAMKRPLDPVMPKALTNWLSSLPILD
ncbi:MAG: alpha/beta hydrolase family protein [Xenococcaceae cyanobacterium]